MDSDREIKRQLERSYVEFVRIEPAFLTALDGSLSPRGPDLLYEIVEAFALEPGASVVDVGCGEGRHARRLARDFGFSVLGVDPIRGHVDAANAQLASIDADAAARLRFALGAAEALSVEDATVDLVWCRDVLVHVADVERAYAEFARVLRRGGRALVYQMFATDRLEPREGEWLRRTLGLAEGMSDPARAETAIAAAGLGLDERIDLGPEWGEWAQEQSGAVGRRLLHAARLLRDPDRYRTTFGQTAYEIMLADCLWQIYAMIGKLERRVFVLSKPRSRPSG